MTQALSLILWFVTHVMWQNAPCLPGGIEFTRQGQVDSFNIRNPGCDQVTGTVTISGNDITNLDSLKLIKSVGGHLFITGANNLKNLNGLSGLQSVQGLLEINSVKQITTLSGLHNLVGLSGGLNITNNDSLRDITALNQVSTQSFFYVNILRNPKLAVCNNTFLCNYLAAGAFVFFENNAPGCNDRFQVMKACYPSDLCPSGAVLITRQSDIAAFTQNFPLCTQLPGNLNISGSGDTLTHLMGLPKIKTIGGSLTVNNHHFLLGLQGLDSLTYVGNHVNIGYNKRIKNLNGLGSLNYVEDNLVIYFNDSLLTLSGLGNVDPAALDILEIYNNPHLSTCASNFVCTYLAENDSAIYSIVFGNALGCSSLLDIQRICNPGDCPPGDLVFKTQQEVDLFPSWFPGCTEVQGSLRVSNTPIKNLDSLYRITSLGYNLDVSNNDSLLSIEGLSHLKHIGNEIYISNNKILKSLHGLDSVQDVLYGVILSENDSLQDISALNQLDLKQSNYLEITYNSSLSTCSEPFVCNYVSQGYNMDCYGNANGCSSILQVIRGCNPDAVCPPGNISLLSQEDVNYFGQYFPDCRDLPGSLYLESAFDSITSLVPLSALRSIGGGLSLFFHRGLTSLHGLDSLEHIAYDLSIQRCDRLKNLEGLGSLRAIINGIFIEDNDSLETLQGIGNFSPDSIDFLELDQNPRLSVCSVEPVCNYIGSVKVHIEGNALGCGSQLQITQACNPGLECPSGGVLLTTQANIDEFYEVFPNCTSIAGTLRVSGGNESSPIENLQGLRRIKMIQGDLKIDYCVNLKHLYGLDSLESITGGLFISTNDSLADLQGLGSLMTIGTDIEIGYNPQIMSLAGIDQLNGSALRSVNMYYNPLLTYCASPPICAFLANPNANFTANNNGPGCSVKADVRLACGIFECLPDGISLNSQEDVDAFPANYPGCDRMQGDLFISGSDITNLDSLIQLRYLLGGLAISVNPLLNNLNGLSNLVSSYYLDISSNNILTDLSGLSQLSDVVELYIYFNPVLTNLGGLHSIDPLGLQFVDIEANPFLRVCEIQSICDFLETSYDPSTVYIQDNATGCNSVAQVRTACGNATCPPGDLLLTSQAEVDQYPLTYKDCTILPGDLIIQGEGITSLDSLRIITAIEGELRISNTSLKSLRGIGFINPASITHLVIENNDSLSICEVRVVCDYLAIASNTFSIFGNAPTCADLNAIMVECAKTCFWDGLTLTSQAEVDAFPVNFPTCYIVPGFLTITGSGITHLDSLYNLESIGGITIVSTSVTNLHGLENLKALYSSLSIRFCSNLTDISQLQNLDTIGGNLRIEACNQLTNLHGLEKIRSVPFTTTITNNAQLASLQGLSSLQRAELSLTISINPLLPDLTGLESLVSVGSQLLIQNNATLKTLAGLTALKSTGGNCRVENNAMLDSLVGLSALETVGSAMTIRSNPLIKNIKSLTALKNANSLTITNNPMLNSLSGVENLDPVRLNGLSITNSPLLSVCNYRSICNYLNNPAKSATIGGNATGCTTRTQILNSCASILPVSLYAFTAKLTGHKTLVQWSSAFESRLDHYEIEHSIDGSVFKTIGKRLAGGDLNEPRTYRFMHDSPGSGPNFYRLKLVQQSSDFSYSEVVKVHLFHSFSIFPNPTLNKVYVGGWEGERANVKVKDIMGRALFETNISPDEPVDLSQQPAGIYILTVTAGRQESVFRVLRN